MMSIKSSQLPESVELGVEIIAVPLYIGLHRQVTMASKPLALKLETDEMLPMKGKYISKQKQWEATVSFFLCNILRHSWLSQPRMLLQLSAQHALNSTRLIPESPCNPDLVTLSFNTSVIFCKVGRLIPAPTQLLETPEDSTFLFFFKKINNWKVLRSCFESGDKCEVSLSLECEATLHPHQGPGWQCELWQAIFKLSSLGSIWSCSVPKENWPASVCLLVGFDLMEHFLCSVKMLILYTLNFSNKYWSFSAA